MLRLEEPSNGGQALIIIQTLRYGFRALIPSMLRKIWYSREAMRSRQSFDSTPLATIMSPRSDTTRRMGRLEIPESSRLTLTRAAAVPYCRALNDEQWRRRYSTAEGNDERRFCGRGASAASGLRGTASPGILLHATGATNHTLQPTALVR